MDNINFLAKDSFPVSSETLSLMQDMIALASETAKLGGDNYILEGCTENDGIVSKGIIVIAGELFSFSGGEKKGKIKITEIKKTINAFEFTYDEAYKYRIAEFSDTEGYNWIDFKQVESNLQLTRRLNEISSIPKGLISMWSGSVDEIPQGWALCNGQNNTPNLQGMFIVGYSTLPGDYDTIGKKGGEEKHPLTIEELPDHDHGGVPLYMPDTDRGGDRSFFSLDDQFGRTSKVGENKPHENRPPYFVLAYIIKI